MKALNCWQVRLAWLLIVAGYAFPANAQVGEQPAEEIEHPLELLPLVNVARNSLGGTWKRVEASLVAAPPGRPAMMTLPVKLDRSYAISFEFTRTDGDNSVGLLLPLGDRQCALELSGWKGEAHGISRVDGLSTKESKNPTSVMPGRLVNDQRYEVDVNVKQTDDVISINVQLDGKALIDWNGNRSRLESNLFIRSGDNNRLVLTAIDSTVEFHRVTLISGGIEFDRPQSPQVPGTIDLTTVQWKETSGTTRVSSFRGERVLELSGEEAVAFLPDLTMADGTIECEIASATFSGLAFRGVDTDTFECLYFRPFNSGTAKHENTVQYASHGVEGGGWADLRREFPGKYEAGADMKTNQWFRVKIVIEGEMLKAFVDDAKQPVLVVEKMLGNREQGKIGVWGWGSYFRDFRFTPATN